MNYKPKKMMELVVGVDIGGTNSAFGIVDREGVMHGQGNILTGAYPDIDNYIEVLSEEIKRLIGALNIEHTIIGIGIGAPNASYFKGTIENAANLAWQGIVPVVEKMKKHFPTMPILITNDANAAAIGEMVYGGAKGMKNFVVVTLGTGVGSGFVVNGEVLYGSDGFAGELGHVIVSSAETGRECGCGRRGCLETYTSATGIKRTVYKLLADSLSDSEFRNLSFNELTAEMITKAAFNKDPLAIAAFEHTGKVLGEALADVIAITSPEAIFLVGGLSRAGDYLFEPTRHHMKKNMLRNFNQHTALLASGLDGRSSAILGASALIWEAHSASI